VLIGSMSVIPAAQAACEPDKVAQKYPGYADTVVLIGAQPAYAPFVYSDPDNLGSLAGMEVEIIERVMQCAGLEFKYIKGVQSGLYPALFSGNIDVMIGNVFFNSNRALKASFVLYMLNTKSLVVRKGNPKRIKSEQGMCGYSASGSYTGSSAEAIFDISNACIEAGREGVTWVPAADQEPAFRSLINNRIDMVMDGTAAAVLRVKSAIGSENLEIAFTRKSDVRSGVIIKKGNREMLAVVSDSLRSLQASGELIELMKRYGVESDMIVIEELQ
jgi:polar amino acid transport system substrate-binding protein